MEKFVEGVSRCDVIDRLKQLIRVGDFSDIQRETMKALRPITDLTDQLYNEVFDLFHISKRKKVSCNSPFST